MDNNSITSEKRKDEQDGSKKSKKRRSVQWQPDWLRDDNLKDWLQKHPW